MSSHHLSDNTIQQTTTTTHNNRKKRKRLLLALLSMDMAGQVDVFVLPIANVEPPYVIN